VLPSPFEPLAPLRTADRFAPLAARLLDLLRDLAPEDWDRRATRRWQVRDVVAHLVDTDLRRVARHRDGHAGPPPPRPITSADDLRSLIDGLNESWVAASARLSPAILIELLELSAGSCAEALVALEAASADAPAAFPVAWAGHSTSPVWLDVARELTDRWHHQQQIRRATGRPFLDDPCFARPVLETFLYALPPAYSTADAAPAASIEIVAAAPVDTAWRLVRWDDGWQLALGTVATGAPALPRADASLVADPESLALALTRSIPVAEARARVRVSGRAELATPFFAALAMHKRPA